MKKVFLLLMGMMFLAGCGATAPQQRSGFLGEYYANLKPVEEGNKDWLRWLKPGVDYSKYNKVMVDYVIFAFAEDSEYKGIDAIEMKELGDGASLAFINALKKEFPVVSEPGPDVIRIRIAITDLRQSNPVISGVTTVVPVGLAVSVVKKGATNTWTGSGATSAEMMVLDSTTNEVLAVGHDMRAAGFTERFSKWGSVEEAFKFWGERFTKKMVALMKK